jgi:hypothetical protein
MTGHMPWECPEWVGRAGCGAPRRCFGVVMVVLVPLWTNTCNTCMAHIRTLTYTYIKIPAHWHDGDGHCHGQVVHQGLL